MRWLICGSFPSEGNVCTNSDDVSLVWFAQKNSERPESPTGETGLGAGFFSSPEPFGENRKWRCEIYRIYRWAYNKIGWTKRSICRYNKNLGTKFHVLYSILFRMWIRLRKKSCMHVWLFLSCDSTHRVHRYLKFQHRRAIVPACTPFCCVQPQA